MRGKSVNIKTRSGREARSFDLLNNGTSFSSLGHTTVQEIWGKSLTLHTSLGVSSTAFLHLPLSSSAQVPTLSVSCHGNGAGGLARGTVVLRPAGACSEKVN